MAGRAALRRAAAVFVIAHGALTSPGALGDAAAGGERGTACGPKDVAVGRYGRDAGGFWPRMLGDGTVLGITSFCVDQGGGVVVLKAWGRTLVLYSAEGDRIRDISLPERVAALRVAARGGRLYALCCADRDRAPAPQGGNVGHTVKLRLLVLEQDRDDWEECGSVALPAVAAPAVGRPGAIETKVTLAGCGGELYLYDPMTCTSIKLADDGAAPVSPGGAERARGWKLPSGARAVRCGWGISLLWDDGSRRDMPWLAGSLIGGDLAGRVYMCQINDGGHRPQVSVAACDGGALASARWTLPGRPGEVRMLGPRIVVSEDGGLYEFWSTTSEFHIARWRIEGELAEGHVLEP